LYFFGTLRHNQPYKGFCGDSIGKKDYEFRLLPRGPLCSGLVKESIDNASFRLFAEKERTCGGDGARPRKDRTDEYLFQTAW
jgi:hypothetical protein